MMPAQERLASDLASVSYGEFRFPVVHNVDAAVNSDPSTVAGKLALQVSSSVRWLETVRNLTANGVDGFVEVGPGKVLTGLMRQIDRDARSMNVADTASLRNTLETI
jgi:[acyl-carrier-protein] S-malonyltransferase